MVTAHSAPVRPARSRVFDAIALWCVLAYLTTLFSPVRGAARLAARLAFPLRSWRSLRVPCDRSPSARRGAIMGLRDRSRLRLLPMPTSTPKGHFALGRSLSRRPDVSRSITRHVRKTSHEESMSNGRRRARPSAITLSHRRALLGESLRSEQPADPHEARNSHQCEPARDAGRDPRGRPTRGATRRPSRSSADGWRHLPR